MEKKVKKVEVRMPLKLWEKASIAKVKGKIMSLNQGCIDGLESVLTKVIIPKQLARKLHNELENQELANELNKYIRRSEYDQKK
jgi:hypothetical protein